MPLVFGRIPAQLPPHSGSASGTSTRRLAPASITLTFSNKPETPNSFADRFMASSAQRLNPNFWNCASIVPNEIDGSLFKSFLFIRFYSEFLQE